MSLNEVRKSTSSDQSRLASFGTSETTYIAIVRSPSDDLADEVDEVEPRLAPPEQLFYQWLNTRNNLKDEGMPPVQAHNEAIDRVDYVNRFEDHLDTDESQAALRSIADRVADDEHVVLVCYCGEGKWCHRSVVFERLMLFVEKRVDA